MGDNRDHVAFDPELRPVTAVVPGKRTAGNAEKAVSEFQKRTDTGKLSLITGDEYRPCRTAVLNIYGKETVPPRTGKPGRPAKPYTVSSLKTYFEKTNISLIKKKNSDRKV